jgi:hypothetical protein
LTPPVAGADLRAALVANCFLGALPPVDLRAVCLVRAIFVLFGYSQTITCAGSILNFQKSRPLSPVKKREKKVLAQTSRTRDWCLL